jgi:hypothetical protein
VSTSLAEQFESQRSRLVAELGGSPDPPTVLKVMRELFDRLAQAEASEQVRMMLETLRNGVVGTFFSLRTQTPRHRPEPRNPLGAIGSLITRGPEPPPPTEKSTVDVDRLLDQLRASFEAADRVLAEAEPPPPVVVTAPWSADSELLDLCQDLLEAQVRGDGELALHHVERIRRSLPLRHGIDVVTADGTNDELFKFRASVNPHDTENITIRPALVSGDRILRRGEVTTPDHPVPTGTTIEERGDLDG